MRAGIVFASRLMSAGCATIGRLTDPNYFQKQSTMQLRMLGRACSSSPFCVALCLLIVIGATPSYAAPEDTLHPLDPLTAQEITLAADTLKAQAAFPKDALFSTIALHEPPKQEVLDFKPGSAFRREAFAIVMDRANNKVFEAVIDLKAGRVSSWK